VIKGSVCDGRVLGVLFLTPGATLREGAHPGLCIINGHTAAASVASHRTLPAGLSACLFLIHSLDLAPLVAPILPFGSILNTV
jgi:hypothetical protein